MRITQGCFSFLPDLTDDQILTQVQYCLDNGWAVNLEFTDDPHPRNTYWEMWGLPMFDIPDAKGVLLELESCRKIYGDRYIRLSAFDSSHGWESVRISFIVNRPKNEEGFRLDRSEAQGRVQRYATRAYATDRPEGKRYDMSGSGEARAATPERIDLAAEFAQSGVGPVLQQLDDELVGLAPVKQRIREIAALLLVDRVRSKFGLSAQAPTLHMSFTGNPGTGKTTVAARMAEILHKLGYVRRGHLVAVTRDDLVGQYIGHTAPKTKEVLKKAMGGVLFIDEAYYLYRQENERDYGQESIEILLQVMENNRDDLVVILAGYADKMDRFFHSNPGFRSRVAHHIDFPDYADSDLMAIGEKMLASLNYTLSPEAKARARRIYFVAPNAAAVRQRAFDPQRAGPRPPASGQSPVCGRRPGIESRRAHHDRGRRHPPEQSVPTTGNKRITHCSAADGKS